jgi:hypothetical protein
MVADFLQQDLMEELVRIFNDETFKAPGDPSDDGNEKRASLHVFAQNLSIPEPTQLVAEDVDPAIIEEGADFMEASGIDDLFPYIIVRVETGKVQQIDGNQTVEVRLLFGVYDDAYLNNGHRDVLHMIHKIYERFSKNPLLAGKYELVMPMEWALQDEGSYPYFFGGMDLNFETLPIVREDPYT